ncbi:pyroglutamyl-peptidase I [Timonella sp. A28]|uniref:pyroglutamyl-peptidase I n=1 Tax=Timonella sp. A28 TaxID=3442640 RepID=UPI003EBCBDF4
MKQRILLTGFEPFAGASRNPSQEAVELVAQSFTADNAELHTAVLAVEFAQAQEQLAELIEHIDPTIIVCVGVAGGRSAITPERVAINLADARIPDNSGAAPIDQPIVENAPAAYFTTLPVKKAVTEMNAQGIPASLSYTAGTYVCNAVMYAILHATAGTETRAGFLHVPDVFDDKVMVTLAELAWGITTCLHVFCETHEDTHISMGRED